jgi:hypothetical protein
MKKFTYVLRQMSPEPKLSNGQKVYSFRTTLEAVLSEIVLRRIRGLERFQFGTKRHMGNFKL